MTSSARKSPWQRLKPNFSIFWRGSLIVAIPTLFLVASMLIIAGLRSRTIEAREEEKQERQVLTLTEQVLQDLVDAQTGIRGYALTGETEFLQAYQEAQVELPQTLEQLEIALADDPVQLAEFRELEPLINQKIAQLGEKLTTIQELDTPLVQNPQLTQQLIESNETMAQLRDRVAVFIEAEQQLGEQREALVLQWRNLTTNVQWLVLAISLMAGVAAIYLFYLLDQELLERTLRQQETNLRLEAVFDSVVDGIITLDAHGQIESCNQSAAQIFGYELGEMVGLSFQSLVADRNLRNSQDTLNHFLGTKGNKLNRFQETVGQRKSQDSFPMELGLSRLQNDSDYPEPLYIALVRDITERKQAEATLRKQAKLLDLANDSIIVRDLDDRITYWNRGAQRLFGWRTEEALGKTIGELLHTQFPDEKVQADYLKAGDWKGELIQTNKQGQSMIVLSSWTLQTNHQGQPLSHLQIDKDVTEAKKAELALRHSEEMYRTLVENFPNGAVFLFDHHLRYTLAAGTDVCQTSGQSDDIVGKTLQEVMIPEIVAQLEPLYRAALAGEANLTEISDRDRVYRVHVLPITQADGTVLAGMVMTQDITASKRYEDNLRSRADELARTTGVLAHTTQVLEKRNKELDQFAYIVSHDLKAPLRAIANLSSWIEEDLEEDLDEDTRHQMDLLRGRVHRMESLIEGLLQYSRVGRIETSTTTVNLRELLNEVIDSVAPPKQFTIKLPEALPTFETEVLPLQQVFANLISNAIKHNDNDQGEVTIGVQDLGEAYEFSVSDNGLGIDPKYHNRIFVMFQTLQPRDRVENTGVGLAIVKKIIDDKGGTIRVESEEGKGSTIYFTWLK